MAVTVRRLGEDDWAALREVLDAPESRGRGVADALTAELLSWSREQSFKRLVLWVYDAAPRATAFYRRAGFLPTGRTETFNDPDRRLSLMAQTL